MSCALVFCATREGVKHLASRLAIAGLASSLCRELSQHERTRALQAMRDGRAQVCVATDVARAASTCQMRLIAEEIPSFEIFNRYVRKDGATLWVHKRVSLLRDASGRPSHIIGLVTDMSERKRHEEHTQLLMREVNHRSKNIS